MHRSRRCRHDENKAAKVKAISAGTCLLSPGGVEQGNSLGYRLLKILSPYTADVVT